MLSSADYCSTQEDPSVPSDYAKLAQAHEVIYCGETDKTLPSDARKKNNTRYLYFKKIAQGGKCNIQSCRDLHLGRVICHKALRREFADDPEERRLFLREARVTAMLQHPNTAPVYEVGSDAMGHYYFTMKLVAGATLREVVDGISHGDAGITAAWDLHRLIDVVIQVGQVLSYAHVHGVVHCDVKPENIVVGAYGEVLLLDWGLAYIRSKEADPGPAETVDSSDHSPLHSQESHPGTPLYMSPEQVGGKDIDHRTDIYSLGAILFEILTQQKLAWGNSLDEILRNKIDTAPPTLSMIAPDRKIPVALESLCQRCIQQMPDHRIQTMLEVIHELLYWLRVDNNHRPM
jgi:serine/threonine protein kinase